jgi:ammonium transporter, Amt family
MVMIQRFMSLSWTTVLSFAFGCSMCFGPTWEVSSAIRRFLRGVNLQTMFAG